jgi:hypothetical protein
VVTAGVKHVLRADVGCEAGASSLDAERLRPRA